MSETPINLDDPFVWVVVLKDLVAKCYELGKGNQVNDLLKNYKKASERGEKTVTWKALGKKFHFDTTVVGYVINKLDLTIR